MEQTIRSLLWIFYFLGSKKSFTVNTMEKSSSLSFSQANLDLKLILLVISARTKYQLIRKYLTALQKYKFNFLGTYT